MPAALSFAIWASHGAVQVCASTRAVSAAELRRVNCDVGLCYLTSIMHVILLTSRDHHIQVTGDRTLRR